MNKTAQNSFTFGIFLVGLGLIGHYLGWQQAQIIIILGIVFESFAAMVFIWNKMKGKQ